MGEREPDRVVSLEEVTQVLHAHKEWMDQAHHRIVALERSVEAMSKALAFSTARFIATGDTDAVHEVRKKVEGIAKARRKS